MPQSHRAMPTWASAIGVMAFFCLAIWRSPALALGLAIVSACAALLLFANPPFSRLSWWTFVAMLVAAVPAANLTPPGLPGAFMAWRLLLALFLGLVVLRLTRGERPRLPRLSGPAALWPPLATWAVLSLLWCRDLAAGLRYCAFLAVGIFLLFAIRHYAHEPRRLRVVLGASAATAMAVIAYGVFERLSGIHLPESAVHDLPAYYSWMVTSVFRNSNEFATYIALWLPLFIVSVFAARSLRVRLVSAGVCAMGAFCLLCTGSRGNILALALACMLLLALTGVRWPLRVGPILVLAALAGLYGLQTFGQMAPQHQLGALRMKSVVSEGTQARGGLLRDGVSALAKTWGAGLGAGSAEGYMGQLGHDIQNLHNWWLEILVNLGVLAFVCYVWFYLAVMKGLYLVSRRTSDRFLCLAAIGLLAGWIGFSIGCLSSSSLIAWAPMWIYFGICLAVIEAHAVSQRIPPDAPPSDFASLPHSG